MLQTNFLWYLMKINQYKSLSATAEALHISQPALSSAIKTLEEQLGTKLLNRTNKGVSLTEDGKKVVEKANQVFSLLDDIEFMFQKPEKQDFLLDDIIIYTNPAYSANLISALSANFNDSKATNALQIFNIQPGTDVNKLIMHSNNTVILTILPEDYSLNSNANMTVLGKSASYVMYAPGFPYFSASQTSVSMKELLEVPFAVSKVAFEFQTSLLNMLSQYGKPNIRVVAPDNMSVTAAITSGIATSFSNKFFSNRLVDSLIYLPIRNAPRYNLALIYGKNMNPAVIEALTDLLMPLLS